MTILAAVYVLNAVILILHEIESAYWKEWEILGIPGGMSVFVALHLPLLAVLFWGVIELVLGTRTGSWIAMASGAAGLLPLVIHRVLARRPGSFNAPITSILLYSNVATGVIVFVLAMMRLTA